MKSPHAILAAVIAVAPSLSAAGMRCGNQLVLKGYNFDEVSQVCGEADSTYDMGEKYIYRSVRNSVEEAAIAEVVNVEMWVYRGPDNKFSRNLYFENGILVDVELGRR